MNKKQNTVKVLGYLAALYPRFELTEATVDAYHDMLRDIRPALLQAAVQQVGAESKWFPTVAELRGAVKAIQNRALGIPTPAEAWGEVLRQVALVGYYGSPEFDDDGTAATVNAMGWRYLCTSEDQMADRAHFLKMYGQIAHVREQERTSLPAVNEEIKRLAAQMGQVKQLEAGA